MKRSSFAYPYGIWIAIFIVVPLIMMLYYAFTDAGGGVTLDNMKSVFSPMHMEVLAYSLLLALISTVICLLLGYPFAYFLANTDMSRSSIYLVLIMVPMWMNFLLRTYAWVVLLEQGGPINSFLAALNLPRINILYTPYAVVLGMVYNFLPFMVLPIYTVLSKIDPSYAEAARDLGAGHVRVFFKVTFPLSMQGVISGITMTFMPAASTFVISRLLGGGKMLLFGDLIENQFLLVHNRNMGSALSIVLMVLVLLTMVVFRQDKGDSKGGMIW